jgi:DNA polymerase delta subunit 4
MAPAVLRSYSQSKISDAFKSSTKTSKPLKQSKQPVKSISKTPSPVIASTTPQTVEDTRAHLNPSDPALVKAARTIEADRQAPFGRFLSSESNVVHPESQNTIHTILRNFDLSPKYGPCVGISRIDRYKRAEKMGLKPPIEVLKILETPEGDRDWNTDLFSQRSAV